MPTKCFKLNDTYYKTIIYYIGDYETALRNKQFDKNDFMITIKAKDEAMPGIRINLIPDTPEIVIIDNGINLGIIHDYEINEQIERLKEVQAAIQNIRNLFHTHFPQLL